MIKLELEIKKSIFLELENISYILSYLDKLVIDEIIEGTAKCSIDIDISYKDINEQECFKSLPFDFRLELDGIKIDSITLEDLKLYIVDRKGVNVEYILKVIHDESKEIEIIEVKNQDDDIVKIKEDISKEYEEKLHNELNERKDISVVSTKSKSDDFLSFFNKECNKYYKIKTLECNSENELNIISKEYKIPYQELLYGYDKENGKVVFKLKE